MNKNEKIKKRFKLQFLTFWILFSIVVVGWFYPIFGYLVPICLLASLVIAIFLGRYWCDWMCPRGAFWDYLFGPISPKKELPKVFQGLTLRIIMMMILMTVMTVRIYQVWPNYEKIGSVFVMIMTVTTIVGIILAITLHYRAWCLICPAGTMSNWIGGNKYPLKIDEKLCTDCKLCYKNCPMQIAPYLYKDKVIVKNGDCIKCPICIEICPKKALEFSKVA